MTAPAYGIVLNRENLDPRPSLPSDLSVIGLVLPATGADATFLPLNTPVAFDSGDSVALGKLGTGDLANAVVAIDDQLADYQSSARIVAVRVSAGANRSETISNIVGSAVDGTGLYALKKAGQLLGVIPRLIGAPGFTGDFTRDGGGQAEANPICAALPTICSALIAHAIVDGPGTTQQDALDWRETIASDRIIPVDAWVKAADGTFQPGSSRWLGIAARVDFKHGGYPFWSFSGQQVSNILGLKNYWPFSLTDGANAGQEMLAQHVNIIARGEAGVETAIAASGFVTAGVWNAGADPLWHMYNRTRQIDWLHLSLLKSVRLRLGVENVTPHSVQAVLNDMTVVCNDMMQNGGTVGFRVGFEASRNNESNLREGKFRVFVQNEGPAAITQVTIDSRPYYAALTAELQTLIAQAATLVPQFIS